MVAVMKMSFTRLVLLVAAAILITAGPAGAAEGEGVKPTYYLNEKILNLVFMAGESMAVDGGTLIRKDAGELNLPGGQIVACDVVGPCNYSAHFTTAVAPGKYPAAAFIKNFNDGDRRTALAAVFFSAAKAARWELAVTSRADPAELKAGEFFGYPVDAGTGGFMSAEAAAYYEKSIDWPSGGVVSRQLLNKFEEADKIKDYTPVINLVIDSKNDLNLIAVHSGYGDGYYPSYFGYDADGRICCLVTDFLIFDEKQAAGAGD